MAPRVVNLFFYKSCYKCCVTPSVISLELIVSKVIFWIGYVHCVEERKLVKLGEKNIKFGVELRKL